MNEERKASQLAHDLGNFECFNFTLNAAVPPTLSAEEVVAWDYDEQGEAEFWPDGEHAGLWLVFKHQSCVSPGQLLALDELLTELGDDSPETFLRIHYCVSVLGCDLCQLSATEVEDQCLHVFSGESFIDTRKEAAHELFELYYPEEYAVWEKSLCDGLLFDEDRFLDSPVFTTTEVKLAGTTFVLVAAE